MAVIFNQPQMLVALAAVCYRCALPPVGLSFLAWAAPVFWTALIRQAVLSGRISFYATVWLGGALFWLTALTWICFDVWWTQVIWVIISFLLASNWVLFIGLSRAFVHGLRIPVIVSAPIVWCGLEWVRKNWLWGGFSLASLEHSQYKNAIVIQSADLFGEYGVGALIVFVGACAGRLLPVVAPDHPLGHTSVRILDGKRFAIAACACVIVGTATYGLWRLHIFRAYAEIERVPKARIALLQGNADFTHFLSVPITRGPRCEQHRKLSSEAGGNVDLVVWPEDSCNLQLIEVPHGFVPVNWEGQSKEATERMLQDKIEAYERPILDLAAEAGTNVLLNVFVSSYDRSGNDHIITRRNSAVLVDPERGIGPRHDKVHLVPLVEGHPSIRSFLGEESWRAPFTPGDRMVAFPIYLRDSSTQMGRQDTANVEIAKESKLHAAVNICYDDLFPHFVRRQVTALAARGENPDVLINMSNDRCFQSFDMAEMHLAVHVFRAVENRKPYLIATNGGYSAWIDCRGRIVKRGEKDAVTYIVAEIGPHPTMCIYATWGDWLPIACLWIMILLGFILIVQRWRVVR